jgi:hypothetical protein
MRTMIEYYQLLLQKVSFDRTLFEKELLKGIRSLVLYEEVCMLKDWCLASFKGAQLQIV